MEFKTLVSKAQGMGDIGDALGRDRDGGEDAQ